MVTGGGEEENLTIGVLSELQIKPERKVNFL
jgi:hypothetical protein